jgi:RHS repeat-associated protein
MNVTSLVNAAGDALERYVYDPYGRVTIYDDDWSTEQSPTTYNNYVLYTGRHLDAETGLYYYRARYYDAVLGRFVNRDPILYDAGDSNLYRYISDSPLNNTDPSGLATLSADQQADLKGCKCEARKVGSASFAVALGYVKCVNGKPVPAVNDKIGTYKEYHDCGLDECTLDHEKHHIAQTEVFCPDFCKGKTCDEKKDEYYVFGFETANRCADKSECWATYVSLNCAITKAKEFMAKKNKKCMLAAADYLENEIASTEKYNCDLNQQMKQVPGYDTDLIDNLRKAAEAAK